jgi:AcrR family transcriptional regulator
MSGLREKRKEKTKKAIMEAALRLFGTRGYDNTSIAALAKEAGIGKGTIYSYFSSKNEILLAFCEEELACLHQEVQQELMKENSFKEKLLQIFMFEFRYVTKNKDFGRTLMREMLFPKELTVEKSRTIENQFINLFVILFKAAQEQGELRHDVEMTMTFAHFYSLYLIALSAWYSGRLVHEEDVQETLELMFHQALQGLQPE